MLHPGHQILFSAPRPTVELLDFMEDTSNLTTYTWTNRLITFGGNSAISGDTASSAVSLRAGKEAIYAIIHSEDDAITFNISSASIGGVAGTELRDRGGGTSAINTAIYRWYAQELSGITSTDVSVTHSEAVTGCAVGIVRVRNTLMDASIANLSAVGATNLNLAPVPSTFQTFFYPVVLIGSTQIDNTGVPQATLDNTVTGSNNTGWMAPTPLYAGSNAEFGYGAWWLTHPGLHFGSPGPILINWSSASAVDASALMIY